MSEELPAPLQKGPLRKVGCSWSGDIDERSLKGVAGGSGNWDSVQSRDSAVLTLSKMQHTVESGLWKEKKTSDRHSLTAFAE